MKETMVAPTKKYVSPLKDELKLAIQKVGEGVILHYDEDNKRLLLDIDTDTRRGISSSLKTVKIATATFQIPETEKMKLTLNIYDKEFNKEELVQLDEKIDLKAEEQRLKKNLIDL